MLLIFSLLLFVSILNKVNSQINAIENPFINIVPYATSDCSGDVIGVGYSSILFTCLTFDYNRNYIFKHFPNSNIVEWTAYQSVGGSQDCTNETPLYTDNFNIGDCIPFEQINNLNYYYASNTSYSLYYKISVTKTPFIPSQSVVNSNMANECTTDSSNAILYLYITNNVNVNFMDQYNTIFTCENGIPYLNYNQGQGPYNIANSCQKIGSFYNSSYEVNPPVASGCWGPGTGESSDQSSGGSSGTGSTASSSSSQMYTNKIFDENEKGGFGEMGEVGYSYSDSCLTGGTQDAGYEQPSFQNCYCSN